MAISYPRDLPDYLLTECTFELLEGVVSSPFGRGKSINRSQTTDPVWKASIQTIDFWLDNRADAQAWSAWKLSMRGGHKTFVTYDKTRENPLAYLGADDPTDISDGWNGTCGINSFAGREGLTLANMPVGYQARTGDRLGLEQSGRYGYFEILESKTANGSGQMYLPIAPFLPIVSDTGALLFTTAAIARLWRPKAKFVIDWRSWQQRGLATPEPASFEAYQV